MAWDLLSQPIMYWVTIQVGGLAAIGLQFRVGQCTDVHGSCGARAGNAAVPRPRPLSAGDIAALDRRAVCRIAAGCAARFRDRRARRRHFAVSRSRRPVGASPRCSPLSRMGRWCSGSFSVLRNLLPTPARPWEGWAVSLLIFALFVSFAVVPWPAVDPLLQPMLFCVPLAWLALRFSRRTTNIGVVIVATGIVWFAGHGIGIYRGLAGVDGWPHVVIAHRCVPVDRVRRRPAGQSDDPEAARASR